MAVNYRKLATLKVRSCDLVSEAFMTYFQHLTTQTCIGDTHASSPLFLGRFT
jgi:hypothetical protein